MKPITNQIIVDLLREAAHKLAAAEAWPRHRRAFVGACPLLSDITNKMPPTEYVRGTLPACHDVLHYLYREDKRNEFRNNTFWLAERGDMRFRSLALLFAAEAVDSGACDYVLRHWRKGRA